MWYKNIAGTFFGLVTKHACDRQTDGRTDGGTDRQTDRMTTPKTALAQLRRAVKTDNVRHEQFTFRTSYSIQRAADVSSDTPL